MCPEAELDFARIRVARTARAHALVIRRRPAAPPLGERRRGTGVETCFRRAYCKACRRLRQATLRAWAPGSHSLRRRAGTPVRQVALLGRLVGRRAPASGYRRLREATGQTEALPG